MKHSIISWDSSYRNFFHLIDGLVKQDYPRDEYELIYIEQRSKEFAKKYAEDENVKSLEERYKETVTDINIKIDYLNHPITRPYHLGKCNNRGLELAQGKYISVMDGDQLLPSNFLSTLDSFFGNGGEIANVIRRMADHPVGVSKKKWKDALIDFDKCLEVCPDKDKPIPEKTNNKGPLISAHRDHWKAVNGYSEHKLWSTGLSRLGQDVCKRLEIETGEQSRTLSNIVTVHPWHPTGFSRSTISNRKLLYIQKKLIEWSEKNKISDWKKRKEVQTNKVYKNNKNFIDKMIYREELALPGQAELSDPNITKKILLYLSSLVGQIIYS